MRSGSEGGDAVEHGPGALLGPDGKLSAASLVGRNWCLQRANGDIVATRLVLLADGQMGLHRHRDQWRWSVENGLLIFTDWHGRLSAIFNRLERDRGWVFSGACRTDDQERRLIELEPVSTLSRQDNGLVLHGARKQRRRNLVVLRADERSLHTAWPADVQDIDRNWDLCVSFYGATENFPPADFAEFHVRQAADRKFPALYKLFHTESPLWDYDYVMFPDDDLMMSRLDLNNVFEICREHRLDLAQPALTADSFWGQQITLQQPNTLLRYVSFVESMMPIFSIQALRLCAPTFRRAVIGWGLDCIWPSLIGSHASRVAIIDLVAVRHTRPVGSGYGAYDAGAEGAALQQLYGVEFRMAEFGRLILA